MKYFQAIYGESIVMDMQQMAQMSAMYPQFQAMAGRMQTEGAKMQGTPLSTTTTFDAVKSAGADEGNAADAAADAAAVIGRRHRRDARPQAHGQPRQQLSGNPGSVRPS